MNEKQNNNEQDKKSNNPTVSVGIEAREKFMESLKEINSKDYGNKISPREYLEFLMTLQTPERVKELKLSSIKGKAKNDLYKKRFFEKYKNKTEDDFYDFIWSDKATKFKKENKDIFDVF